ncbi:hypothetical protein J4449_01500 [Candidatus Woesearchaeota archaeon]|nr:hypothetical protein [Candidatus Woesearchaeota archaeon]
MQYALHNKKTGEVKTYEVSYSQVLQEKTNRLLTTLIILIFVLLLVIGYTLIKVDTLNIPTRLIYGW